MIYIMIYIYNDIYIILGNYFIVYPRIFQIGCDNPCGLQATTSDRSCLPSWKFWPLLRISRHGLGLWVDETRHWIMVSWDSLVVGSVLTPSQLKYGGMRHVLKMSESTSMFFAPGHLRFRLDLPFQHSRSRGVLGCHNVAGWFCRTDEHLPVWGRSRGKMVGLQQKPTLQRSGSRRQQSTKGPTETPQSETCALVRLINWLGRAGMALNDSNLTMK